jgi:hypothetical protein
MPDHLPPEDDELELEPIDPIILAHQRQRGQQKTDHAQAAVDADLVRQAETLGDPIALEDLKQFRFTTRHLMILTALLALIMTFCQLWGAGLGLFVSAMIAVSAGWLFTMRREQRQRNAADRLRRELAAQQVTRLHGKKKNPPEENRSAESQLQTEQVESPAQDPELNFSFSLKEMLITFTAAAVLLGLVSLFGPGPLAILLGMIALGGLVAQAVGLEAPVIVVFGWWILLVLYLLLGLWSSTTNEAGAVSSMSSRSRAVSMQTVGPETFHRGPTSGET